MALDYAAIMQAGQGLVPDLRAQMFEDGQRRQQQQVQAMKLQQAQVQQTRTTKFQEAAAEAVRSGNPQAIGRLMVEYPEFADQIKPGWEALSEQGRRRNLTQVGTVYARANAGDMAGAADALQARHDADVEAGVPDETTQELIDALRSNDPNKQHVAIATLGMIIAADDPSKFAERIKAMNPAESKTQVQREYEWRVGQFSKAAADEWLAVQDTELVPVEQGGAVYDKRDFSRPSGVQPATAPSPRGGDLPASGPVSFTLPVQGSFGDGPGASRDGGTRRHNGLDIRAAGGSPVMPAAPGQVVKIGSDPKSGTFVKVRHADGSTTSYSHLGSVNVRQGDQIAPGQSLGTVGSSGNATGNVLHFVVRDANGALVDPRRALSGGSSAPRPTTQKTIGGKTYYQIGGRWFDNPEGR